ncbi:MAG: class I SAM-dependent methyltransferase [Candidatus Paceibacteria bacterium]
MNSKNYAQYNKNAYNNMAPYYKKQGRTKESRIKEEARNFSEYIEKTFERPKILEIGPGAGVGLGEFEARGFDTTAIDVSEKMIEISKETAPKTKYLVGNFIDHQLRSKEYDGVFGRSVIHLFPYQKAFEFVEKCYRILTNKGLLHLSTFNYEFPQEGIKEKIMEDKNFRRFKREWTHRELEHLAKNSSFRKTYIDNKEKGHNKGNKTIMQLIK